jgi:hypothetical protein
MARLLPIYAGILLSTLVIPAALAQEDQIIDVKPCTFMCKVWRNVSRKADVSTAAPSSKEAVSDDRIPAPDEGAAAPRTSQLAAEPGSVMVETAADRARLKRQKAKMEQDIAMPATAPGKAAAAH